MSDQDTKPDADPVAEKLAALEAKERALDDKLAQLDGVLAQNVPDEQASPTYLYRKAAKAAVPLGGVLTDTIDGVDYCLFRVPPETMPKGFTDNRGELISAKRT
ncbi:MAG: hypothetical protein HRU11_09060 [Parvularculaceae bacterium]|nr:hypothetical protein [Parvularculaceae bacterium]